MTKSKNLAHGVGSFNTWQWSEMDPVKQGATAHERLQHRIKAHKHKNTFHKEWAAWHDKSKTESQRALAKNSEFLPKHEIEYRLSSIKQHALGAKKHTREAERERAKLAKNQAKLDELRTSKTNTGRKDAKGRTIWKGPKGGLFTMSSTGVKTRVAA